MITLEDPTNLGEAIGGFVVVVSLLFVGYELRRARDVYQNALLEQPVGRSIELGRDFSRHVDVWTRGHPDCDGLSREEHVILSCLIHAVTLDLSEKWLVLEKGDVDSELAAIVNRNAHFFLNSRGARQWSHLQPLGLPRSFVACVGSDVLPKGGEAARPT